MSKLYWIEPKNALNNANKIGNSIFIGYLHFHQTNAKNSKGPLAEYDNLHGVGKYKPLAGHYIGAD